MEARHIAGENVDCDKALSMLLTEVEKREIKQVGRAVMLDDYIVYVRGGDSILGVFLQVMGDSGKFTDVVEAMEQKRAMVAENPLASQVDLDGWLPSLAALRTGEFDSSKPGLAEYSACVAVNLWFDPDYLGAERAEAHAFLEGLTASSSVGYFDVELKSCRVTSQLNTGNQFANPEVWEGSRFLVLDVAFKNKDKESRIPLPGSAFISVDGSIYEFDQPESIMARGYGVPLQGINPLVTYRTKLVYRVPDESFRDVFWQPGRNEEGKRLYCSL
jgi:hypothetical protein